MPEVNGKYVAPTWANKTKPAIDASELQAMSDGIERGQNALGIEFVVSGVGTGATVTATSGSTTVTGTSADGKCTLSIPTYGTWTVTATKGSRTESTTVDVTKVAQYTIALSLTAIYGVTWDVSSSTAWTRTDDAADFEDPVPYVSGATSYGSPFDDLYPWSGMTKVTDSEGGVLVAIPKFWYKWTADEDDGTLTLQIATKETDGFSVSPAHMERGNGAGERDVVYVGRYHCSSSDYKSTTGVMPKVSITRAEARQSISALGDDIWQMDYATRLTIQMLYLVEFADWNSQAKIGYGCGNESNAQTVGASDSMPYHTGTMQTSRTTYGVGVQYRYIEGLWDDVFDWLDGCYYNSKGLNIITNPESFSDTDNGTAVGTPSSGYPKAMSLSTELGFEWCLYPTASGGSSTTYVPDGWYFDSSYPCLCVGGSWNQYLNYGLFFVVSNSASSAYSVIGCRLQKLP